MNRRDFRVKLDLCKYYHDVRRFCWIFITGTKMLQIANVKEHVTRLFGIQEPFHLLLKDTEYLPPEEDSRILKENETIVVVPGSGLGNELESSTNETRVTEKQNDSLKTEQINNSFHHKGSQTIDFPPMLSNPTPITHDVSNIVNETQLDISQTDVSVQSAMEDNEIGSATESKATESNVTEDLSIVDVTIPKKKRVRHRRARRPTFKTQPNTVQEELKPKKPKIIDSFIISQGKHIRFDGTSNDDIDEQQDSQNKEEITNMAYQELSNLLSMSLNPPLTFSSRRVKQEIKVEEASDEETRTGTSPAETDNNKVQVNGEVQGSKTFLQKDLEAYPVMTTQLQVKDIVAFKILKIAADYTPQVSEFIVAEVLSSCPKTSAYTFQILQGISEVQVPIGKFTIVEDETECVLDDTITLNSVQIMEPRLVSGSDRFNK